MEISSVFGNGFQHILILPPAKPLSLSSLAPFPASALATSTLKNPTALQAVSAATTTTTIITATLLGQSHGTPAKASFKTSRTSPISYKERQSAIITIQQSSDLHSALARSGAMLKVQDLNVVLRHFGKLKRWEELSQVFYWMQKNGKISVTSYSSYIKFLGESLNPVKALEIYSSIKDESTKNNVSVCNSVLSCLVRNGKFETSIKLFLQMKQDGLTPDVVTYSTLLAGCSKAKGGYFKALDLVKELKYNGLHMDSFIYGTLLSVCASNNQCKEAEIYFTQMKDEGHSPNVFHYSSLLNAYSANGDHKKADKLVEEMKSAGLVPNKVILTTLLKVYVRGGLYEKSRELLSELEALGFAEDEMPYCLLMDGLAKAGHVNEARLVFDEMNEKKVKNDGYSYSIMISTFCRTGLLQEAKQLACEYEAKYNKFDVVILNTMLCAYCRAGEMDNVMKMMRKIDELAIGPDASTFCILIKYFCKEELYMLAYRTTVDMQSKGHQLEEELCSSLIFHLGKTGAHVEAFTVYNMLKYSKRTICKALHEKILRILIAGRLLKDAYVVVKDNPGLISQSAVKKFATSFMTTGSINLINDVIKAVHSSGSKIDQRLFELAISRYIGHLEKKELLLQLLHWMPGHGYIVNSSTRNLLLKNSHLFGRQLIAEILSKQHRASKALKSHESKDK